MIPVVATAPWPCVSSVTAVLKPRIVQRASATSVQAVEGAVWKNSSATAVLSQRVVTDASTAGFGIRKYFASTTDLTNKKGMIFKMRLGRHFSTYRIKIPYVSNRFNQPFSKRG